MPSLSQVKLMYEVTGRTTTQTHILHCQPPTGAWDLVGPHPGQAPGRVVPGDDDLSRVQGGRVGRRSQAGFAVQPQANRGGEVASGIPSLQLAVQVPSSTSAVQVPSSTLAVHTCAGSSLSCRPCWVAAARLSSAW